MNASRITKTLSWLGAVVALWLLTIASTKAVEFQVVSNVGAANSPIAFQPVITVTNPGSLFLYMGTTYAGAANQGGFTAYNPASTSSRPRKAFSSYFSGLTSSSGPKTGSSIGGGDLVMTYCWAGNLSGTTAATKYTVTMNFPSSFVTATWGTSGITYGVYNNIEPALSLEYNTGNFTYTPVTPPNALTLLDKFLGKTVSIPFFMAPGKDKVSVTIGGVTKEYDVSETAGGLGGVAMIDIDIPAGGWDGSATIDGQAVALAPRTAYSGEPTIPILANPYGPPYPSNLPPGMSRGIPDLPSGMTAGNYYGLPAGVAEMTTLGLPVGMTAINTTATAGGNIITSSTSSTGVNTYYSTNSYQTIKSNTVIPTGTFTDHGGVTIGQGTTGSDAGDQAALDAGMGSPDAAPEMSANLKNYGNSWATLKTAVESKIGDFRPLANGSIPKSSSFSMSLDLGRFGTRSVNLDLTEEPFATARALALVFVAFWAGIFFVKYVKV